MKVTTNIGKLDLIKFNLSVLPKMRSTYITILVIASLTFIYITWSKGLPENSRELVIHLVSSAIGGLLGMFFGIVFNMTTILLMSSAKNGVLGEHTYTLLPEGLIETTSANESLNKWHGVVSVKPAGSYLLIQVAACLFHVIPKRSFDSSEQFEEFTSQAIAHWQQAHNTANNQAQPS
ncbi:YcxB family protein [Stutzerimonas zhaodongensis]|uniref:YcxB family protein n=1 Tax=Stutzerimonas zhaodongensis TaxID=1176257 RepID=A0A3M2HME2_9GAMM|nr:YcxB family protein [Stutzerimonas zhaodongensis]MCQ4318631.1 YcxB family protein [Stutzerimonas zhaodongensis]RMH87447.1 YcxB family protein [Stutzerimonas zhaodongensis]